MSISIKSVVRVVDNLQKLWSILFFVVGIVLPLVGIYSQTLKWVLVGGAALGAVAGFYFTVTGWAGKGREACISRSKSYVLRALVSGIAGVVIYILLQPESADYGSVPQAIRSFLLDFPILFNGVLGGLSLLIFYWGVGAIVLRAPTLWNAKLAGGSPGSPETGNAG